MGPPVIMRRWWKRFWCEWGGHGNVKIMNRKAESDFIARLTAQAMEDEGAQVISITYNGSDTYPNAVAPHSTFIVFARAKDWAHIRRIDEAINKALENAGENG